MHRVVSIVTYIYHNNKQKSTRIVSVSSPPFDIDILHNLNRNRVFAKSFKFIITIFLNNYVQTYPSQVHTQYLTYNYTIIICTNLNINL